MTPTLPGCSQGTEVFLRIDVSLDVWSRNTDCKLSWQTAQCMRRGSVRAYSVHTGMTQHKPGDVKQYLKARALTDR